MTIILFLVDTSSSMCQKAYVNGVQKSYLDIAKGAVETFLKYRQRTQDCLGDRYMLLTFEEPPANVKAGWKENHATFMHELKNLQSTGLTSMGESLKNAFDLLNLNRMQSGIDTYGQGRCPFYLEPSVIIVITDGGRYSYRNGVHQEIILPLNTQIPGTKFTKEPFRWDQRLFSLVLRISGNKIDERVEGKVPHDDSPIERMCEVTGGRSYRVRSHYVLNQCIESLVQKVQPGVVLQFEPMLPKDNGVEPMQDIVFQPTKKMIFVQKHISQKTFPIGYWPLPEPYWPDPKAVTLPPRDAHPKLKIVTPAVDEPQMVRNFPVDKYEIEPCPLTLQICMKREMNKCWQVIISNGMHGFDLPFGYLKAAPNFSQVHLYVLAYNYPALLPLLHDLIHKYNMSPPNDLMYKFNAYVRSIPPYYCPFLRKALLNISVPYALLQFLLPENVDNYLSPTVANQLKHIKNTAKQDQENLCLKVYKQLKQPKPPYRQVETAKLNPGVPLRRELVRHPLLRDTFAKLHAEIEPIENYTIVVPQLTRQASAKSYRNPFDIPRRDLIDEIARMREIFVRPSFTSLVAKDSGYCLPISEMGNYQEYLKSKDNPLREIEPTNVRQHMFGNPYKKDKHMVMVDEADLGEVAAPMKSGGNGGGGGGVIAGPQGGMISGGVGGGMCSPLGAMGGLTLKKMDASRVRKRKAGPIRKDYIFCRMSVDHSRPGTPMSGCTANSSSSSVSTAGSSVGSMSDFDDDSASDTASVCSSNMSEDGDQDRLGASFDFNEEEGADQDAALPGSVRNFMNGLGDESSCDSEMSGPGGAIPPPIVSVVMGVAGGGAGLISPNSSGVPGSPGSGVGGGLSTVPVGVLHCGLNGGVGISSSPALMHGQSPSSAVAAGGIAHPYLGAYGQPMLPTEAGLTPLVGAVSAIGGGVGSGLYAPSSASPHHLNGNSSHLFGSVPPLVMTPQIVASPVSPFHHHHTVQPPPPHGHQLPPAHHATAVAAAAAAAMSAAPVAPAPPPAVYAHQHNDINDAQEISRILQQCHNGNASSSISSVGGGGGSSLVSPYDTHGSQHAAGDSVKVEVDVAPVATPPTAALSATFNHAGATTTGAHTNSFDTLKREAMTTPTLVAGSAYPMQHATNSIASNNHYSLANNHIGGGGSGNNCASNHIGGGATLNNNNNYHYNNTNNSNNNNGANHVSQSSGTASGVQQNATLQPAPPPLTDEQRESARRHNMEVRDQVFRDIRRPGRNYTELLDHLNLIKGDHDMKEHFIQMCITESLRFRRRQMVSSIQEWWEKKQQQQQLMPAAAMGLALTNAGTTLAMAAAAAASASS